MHFQLTSSNLISPNRTNKVEHFSQAIDKLRLSSTLEDAVTLKQKEKNNLSMTFVIVIIRIASTVAKDHSIYKLCSMVTPFSEWRRKKLANVEKHLMLSSILASLYDFTSVFNAHHDGFKSTFKQFTLQLVIRIAYQTQPIS